LFKVVGDALRDGADCCGLAGVGQTVLQVEVAPVAVADAQLRVDARKRLIEGRWAW
jgi:hypothetical protein